MLSLATLIERGDDVIDAIAGDDIVMVRIASGSYYGVADVGRDIWDAVKTPTTVGAIVAKLLDKYDVEPATCEADTIAFLDELLLEELVRVRREPAQ